MRIEIAKRRLKPGEKLVLAGCFKDSKQTVLVLRTGECPIHHMKSDHTRILLHAVDCSGDHLLIVVQSPDTEFAVFCIACISPYEIHSAMISHWDKGQASISSNTLFDREARRRPL